MAEYIERAEVLKKFEEIKSSVDITFADALYLDGVMELIDSVPSADVVEVVRCRDCVRRTPSADLSNSVLCTWLHDLSMPKDGYCSYGEREDKQSET